MTNNIIIIDHLIETVKEISTLYASEINQIQENLFYDSYNISDIKDYLRTFKTNGNITLENNILFFININIKLKNKYCLAQNGVEILKFLRFDKNIAWPYRQAHCILYSYENMESLLRQKPENLLLCSKGTTFIEMPNNFGNIFTDIDKYINDKADPKKLNMFIRGEFNLREVRHRWANIWGIKKLWDIHKLVDDSFNSNYPDLVNKALNEIQAIYADNLFDNNNHLSYKEINKTINKDIKPKREIIANRKPKILYIDDMWNKGWLEILANVIYGRTGSTTKSNNCFFHNIGDEKLIFGIDKYNNKNIERDIAPLIMGLLDDEKPNLILLDLRLKEEEENIQSASLSGLLILDIIREHNISIPIIMATASNKEWVLENILEKGANAYWVKEGFDVNHSLLDSTNNYFKLLDLIEIVTNDDYIFLKKMEVMLDDIRSKNILWWEECNWNRKIIKVSRDRIIDILNNSILIFREYLQNLSGNYRFHKYADEYFWLTNIINKAGTIMELIHFKPNEAINSFIIGGKYETKYENGVKISEYTCKNGDNIGQILYVIRNSSSHSKYSMTDKFTKEHFKSFFSGLLIWLNQDPFVNVYPLNNYPDTSKWQCLKTALEELICKNQDLKDSYEYLMKNPI